MNPRIYTFRLIALFALFNLISGIGIQFLFDFYSLREFTYLKWIVFTLFIILFSFVSYGTSIALLGFWTRLTGRDEHRISLTLQNQDKVSLEQVRIAIVMPIYGEEIQSVIARFEVMYESLKNEKNFDSFDFFILSDTRNLDKWLQEESEYVKLCERLNAYGRIFYRRRKINLNKKSGNLADFCRRWGKNYNYMVVLDADSLMSATTIVQLSYLMELNSNVGIIQTVPKIIQAETFFQKIMQFTSIVHGNLFSMGANYWQLNSSSFWGHNAIVRVKAFMDHCGLPALPKFGAIGGRVLSHDTIEAALLRKAGYSIWCAYDLEGSYEENPPTLTDSLKRDERWCQGNLQHFWFLFAKGLRRSSRLHIFMGIFSYLSSLLWLLFLVFSIFLFIEDIQFFRLSMAPEKWRDFWNYVYYFKARNLFIYTYTILFLPRILVLLEFFFFREYKKMGLGFFSFLCSYIIEFIFSILQAPIMMYMHSKFILLTLSGKKNEWSTQNRSADQRMQFLEVLKNYYLLSLLGAASGGYFFVNYMSLFYLFMPIWLSWVTAPIIVYYSSLKFHSEKLFLSEKVSPFTQEVLALAEKSEKFIYPVKQLPALFLICIDPFFHSVHSLFQKFSLEWKGHKKLKAQAIEKKLWEEGPDSLNPVEYKFLTGEAKLLREIYYRFWNNQVPKLHHYWIENYKKWKSHF